MDQVEEKEENRFQEPTGDRCEEDDKEQKYNSEESSVDRREEDDDEEKEEEKEGSEEATSTAAAVSSLFAHPCSLLRYIARVCACCLGLSDSFCDPKPSAVPAPAAADPSQQGEEEGKMTSEATTRVRAARLRPKSPGNPREGSGGNGGHHH
ncbi:putative E3 ubiquitin-protein ligase RING1a isoform X2 [Oryza brachyantha]|uniref:putative E3 ubiquitin-protein ligase RING1a isoform X2 n=1 Tax=Oryza brachyantha TaxID=4533 RepID=UPI000776151E|nr:putative E3 ubiquitin-protein ligase RING1a isoform X2 [Oryza brachyantha]